MSLSVALQIDPLPTLKRLKDTGLLLAEEAIRRGYHLTYYTPDNLSWHSAKVFAHTRMLGFQDDHTPWWREGEAEWEDLSAYDVILMRNDPPFDMRYLTASYALSQLHPKPYVMNAPAAVRNFPEKLIPMHFADAMPETLITRSLEEISAFIQTHKECILKPLYGFSSASIFKITHDDTNHDPLIRLLLKQSGDPIILQRFVPDILTGDRRVTMVDGQIRAVLSRIPAKGNIRAALFLGATLEVATLNPRQQEICERVGAFLKEHDIILAGVDLIGDFLIEVNITAPTLLRKANELLGLRLDAEVWDAIEKRL